MIPKSKRSEAERAIRWWLIEAGCTHLQPAVRTQWNSTDLFGADCIGRTEEGVIYYIQVTAGGNDKVRQRKRKMDAIKWNPFEHAAVFQLVEMEKEGRKQRYGFREWWYMRDHWDKKEPDAPIPDHWWKAPKLLHGVPEGGTGKDETHDGQDT